MTLTRWRSTILSATRARPPRLGGSSRNAASSSSFLSFFTRRFLSSEMTTTTFGRARIRERRLDFIFVDCLHLFWGETLRAPHVFSLLFASLFSREREKVKNLLEKGEGEDATSSVFFFFCACVLSHRNAFFSYPKISLFHFFFGRDRTTTFFFFVVPGRRRRGRRLEEEETKE